MKNNNQISYQKASHNSTALIVLPKGAPDNLRNWVDWYFKHAVTAGENSQKSQQRDLELFLCFMELAEKSLATYKWTPRLSELFKSTLIGKLKADGSRFWSDRTINRVLTTLKTFAKWVNGLHPFPLGNPMAKVRVIPLTNSLEVERALSASEHRRLLDAADLLTTMGGLSKSRQRYSGSEERPRRKGYRPYRNRAIIYTLTETGMRRTAVTAINMADIDFEKRKITVPEKGKIRHTYKVSKEGLAAIQDYIQKERPADCDKWKSPALFLTPATNAWGNGRLASNVINHVWDDVCKFADIKGRTPHSARHAMGRFIMEQTHNVAAVQRQLGHKNATYSMQYSRITDAELDAVMDKHTSS